MEEKILADLAPKLGLKSDRIIRKATEYMRIADIRGTSSSLAGLNLSSTCKAVMCLELAAVTYGDHVDKSVSVRVSGTRNRKLYTSGLRAMECILDLQSKVTIADLTVQFGCPGAKQLTLQLLKRYDSERGDQDSVEHSQVLFNAAALYAVCRHQKLKIDKSKALDMTGVKRVMFDKIVAYMDKILSSIIKEQTSLDQKQTKRSMTFVEQIEKAVDESSPTKKTRQAEFLETDEESFHVWRLRILTQAYHAIGKTYTEKS